jgi:hypothetical protein
MKRGRKRKSSLERMVGVREEGEGGDVPATRSAKHPRNSAENHNAKAIAAGTGQLVKKGIFMCSEAYAS